MAEWEIGLESNNIQAYSNLEDIKYGTNVFPNYAMCLPRYSKLDGKYKNVKKINEGNIGYMSLEMSDRNGVFANPPSITLSFARKKTSEGLQISFNEFSGDFSSEFRVDWYRHHKLVGTKTYYPNTTNYKATANIGMFDKVVITFLRTNKPYRYCWVSLLDNYRLTQSEGLKVVYYDIAYRGKENTNISFSGQSFFSENKTLKSNSIRQHPHYANVLPRYSKLDGEYFNAPIKMENMGYVSKEISDEYGRFTEPSSVTLQVSEKISSSGIEIRGNNASGDYADCVTISWFENNKLLHIEEFHPDSVTYVCEHPQKNYNKVLISFTHTSKAFRPAYLSGFEFGAVRVFDKKEVISVNCFQDISPLSTEISINTFDWKLLNAKGLNFSTQKRQRVDLLFDKAVVGVFFMDSWERTSESKYSFKTKDVISLLDEKDHPGGIYTNSNASQIIRELFIGEEVELTIDDTLLNKTITGYLPYANKRDNLAQICFAIGAIADTSFDDRVFIYPYSPKIYKLVPDNFIYANSIRIQNTTKTTGIRMVTHSYRKGDSNMTTLFDEVLKGERTIVFNNPCYGLQITGGIIQQSGVNYAKIIGNGSKVMLKGYEYIHEIEIITKENPDVYRDKKFKEIKSATLINAKNGREVLERVYDYYLNSQTLKAEIILDDIELSDYVKIDTFEGEKKGIIQSLNMKFTNEIKAEVSVKCN